MTVANNTLIQSDRLQLVPFAGEHLTECYVGWLNDPIVVRFSDQRHRTHTLESCREYWRSFEGGPSHLWAIVRRMGDPRYIGTMTAYVDPVHEVADVGILIGERSAWQQGYGREAWTAALDFLLTRLGLRKVTAGTIADNQGMLALMRATGMVEDGRRIAQAVFEGRRVDVVHAAIHNGSPQGSARAIAPLRIDATRLYLRDLRLSDVTDRYVAWMNDPDVTRYLESRHTQWTKAGIESFVRRVLRDRAYTFLAMVLKNGDRHVGNIKLGPIQALHRRGEIGIMLGEKDCWGQGYATEAIRALSAHAFERLGLHKVTAGCYGVNAGSIRAFEKSGFVREGFRRDNVWFEGRFIDDVVLGLVRSDRASEGNPQDA